MSVNEALELSFGAALVAGAVVLYRRRGREDTNYGSQTAVLLLFIGAILLIHGLGLLEYRPSAAELQQ